METHAIIRMSNRPTLGPLLLMVTLAPGMTARPAMADQPPMPHVLAVPDVLANPEPTDDSHPPRDDTDGPVRRNVDMLVEWAIAAHPELRASAAEIGREAGLRLQATRKPNPVLGYSASEVGNEGRGGQQGLYVSQEWVTAGKLQIADQAGRWRTAAAAQRRDLARLRVTQRVRLQYWAMIAARQRVGLLNELAELLGDAVRVNRQLLEAAEIGRGSLLQAKLELGRIEVARRQAEADLAAQTRGLAATLNVAPEVVTEIRDDPWPDHRWPDNPWTDDPWTDGAWTDDRPNETSEDDTPPHPAAGLAGGRWVDSPELAEIGALTEAARWSFRAAEAAFYGNLESQAMVQHDAATQNVIVGVQVGIPLPVHDRKRGQLRAAQAEVRRLEADQERLRRDLQTRWEMAVGEFRAAGEMVRAVETELVALTEQRLELARQAYRQGEADYLELLTAQRSFLEVRQSAIDARLRATQAATRLRCRVVRDSP